MDNNRIIDIEDFLFIYRTEKSRSSGGSSRYQPASVLLSWVPVYTTQLWL